MASYRERLLAGVLSGFIAGVVTGLILCGMWMLPALALLATRIDLFTGFILTVVVGVVLGLVYGLVVGRAGEQDWSALLVGLVLGAAAWLAIPVLLIPLTLGLSSPYMNPQLHLSSLVAFLVQGLTISLGYRYFIHRADRKESRL